MILDPTRSLINLSTWEMV